MDLDGLSALLTPQGWALLESLPPYDAGTAMALGEKLRADGNPAPLVAAALTQSRLRSAARAKFGPFADGMLFTPAGLEQATRLPVAARHAQRFAAAGIATVADLGCGIGGDAMALAGLEREVVAVERDELTAAVATVNLRHWPTARVRCEDATTTSLDGVQGAFCDPARRTASGRRVLDPRLGSPPLDWVVDLARRVPGVAMKTAPGIGHQLVPDGVEAQWVSVGGDVVEACLWFGVLARDGVRRSALLLPDGNGEAAADGAPPASPVEIVDDPAAADIGAGPLGSVLYEPDGAVIRAGLVASVAHAVGGRLVDPTIAYVTADKYVRTPLASAWAVEDSFGFQLKTLRTWLRDRRIGKLTIKKRGTAVEPEHLRRQLRLSGDGEATIVLTRLQGRQSVIVARPLR